MLKYINCFCPNWKYALASISLASVHFVARRQLHYQAAGVLYDDKFQTVKVDAF